MLYGTLKQQNPAYRPKLWSKIDDLYSGGFTILEHAERYIPQQINEPVDRYKERITLASYMNYLGMVVDAYAANLFAQEPVITPSDEKATVDEFWAEFADDATLRSESFSKLLRSCFTTSLLKRRALIGCDFPTVADRAETRAAEDQSGAAHGYAFEIPVEDMLDWEYSEVVTREVELNDGGKVCYSFGLLSWAVLRREIAKRATPEDSRSTFIEEFKVWRLDPSGIATWQTFRAPPRKSGDHAPSDALDLPLFAEGATTFNQIPIVELEVPDGLWIGNKLGPIALEMFRRRSALNASETRHLFPVPVVKLGPEIGAVGGALPPDVQQNPGRGNDALDPLRRMGGLVLGHEDSFDFAEPKGNVLELVDKRLRDLVDEFFRVAHMMSASVSSTSKALGRSGSSKAQDHRGMTVILEAYGAIVRDCASRVYDLIADGRKEEVDWKVHGLDKFDVVDREIVLDEAKSIGAVDIPSPTFRVHWQTKVAIALLGNVPPEIQTTIQKEIQQGVAAEEQMRDVMRDAMQDGERGAAPFQAKPGA